MRVEILDGFNVLEKMHGFPSMNDATFITLTSNKMQQLIQQAGQTNSNTYVLARLRPYDQLGPFIQPPAIRLPLFNEYFLLELNISGLSAAAATEPPAPAPPQTTINKEKYMKKQKTKKQPQTNTKHAAKQKTKTNTKPAGGSSSGRY
jgi:hypothetical protein